MITENTIAEIKTGKTLFTLKLKKQQTFLYVITATDSNDREILFSPVYFDNSDYYFLYKGNWNGPFNENDFWCIINALANDHFNKQNNRK